MKKWLAASCLILAVALLSACGSGVKETAAQEGGGGETKEVVINASNYDFDVKEIRVKQGDKVKVTLKNTEGLHAVKFEGYNKEVKGDKTITFTADKKGEFEYICSIFCGKGHAEMVGKLIVE